MIVYGDPAFRASGAVLGELLRTRVRSCARRGGFGMDELRRLLIEGGQLEQAGEDAWPAILGWALAERLLAGLRQANDFLADAFCGRLRDRPAGETRGSLQQAADTVGGLSFPDAPLNVKVPEGFAFYTLYPEQYHAAALRWLHANPAGEELVAVVGIRSIGTTLSAMVTATLRRAGRRVTRLTVRPTGHPFERRCVLSRDQLHGAEAALIVDEGPGLSGSSMAAVALGVMDAGVRRERIALLPGHAREPGEAASDDVREVWRTLPRFLCSLAEMRWEKKTLEEVLAGASGCAEAGGVRDVSGGLWREVTYSREADWPAVCAPFERTKFLCDSRQHERVLWKFAGLAIGLDGDTLADAAIRRIERLAQAGWTPPVLGATHGFLAQPWVEGRPVTEGDASGDLVTEIGRYIAAAAGPSLSAEEWQAAHTRLAEMTYWNVREVLGEEEAEKTREYARRGGEVSAVDLPAYGDGRLAPYEWRFAAGRLLKLDCGGHELDHTVIGRQPITWDVAGAAVEWGITGTEMCKQLAEAVEAASGVSHPPPLLRFHELAYAAFRMGQCVMCAAIGDAHERPRLTHAAERYRAVLVRVLTAAE